MSFTPPGGPPPQAPARAAAGIALITMAARIMGVVRTVVVTSVLGLTFLGNVYATANTVPNLLFEIIAGGALAAVVVPALSRPLAASDREGAARLASALLNRALLIVTPVVIAGLLFRRPLIDLFLSQVSAGRVKEQQSELGTFLLLFFLPQIWLYAAGMVLTGVLHSHRRFAAPALAPLLSSIVVTGSYLLYGVLDGTKDVGLVSDTGKVLLGAGTTLGVAVLSLSLLIPAARSGFRWMPTLRIPEDSKRGLKRLVISAGVTVAAQQLLLGIVVLVANPVEGGVVAYQLAFTVLLLPWATLALPIITTSFPGMSDAVQRGDFDGFAARSSDAARSVTWMVFGGAAIMAVAASPGIRVLLSFGVARGDAATVVPAVIAFAPGLVGYGLFTLLIRTAYATEDGVSASIAAALGFGSAMVMAVAASALLDGVRLITGLAASFSAGISIGALYLLLRLAARRGRTILAGLPGTAWRSALSAAAACLIGFWLVERLPSGVADLLAAIVCSAVTGLVYVVMQRLLGDKQMPRIVAGLRRTNLQAIGS